MEARNSFIAAENKDCLFAIGVEVINVGSNRSVCIHRHVRVFMHDIIIARTLTNNTEVVHIGIYNRIF